MIEYYYEKENVQQGPVEEEQLIDLIKRKEIVPEARIWCEGMPDWLPVKESSFSDLVSQQPPPLTPQGPPPLSPAPSSSPPPLATEVPDLVEKKSTSSAPVSNKRTSNFPIKAGLGIVGIVFILIIGLAALGSDPKLDTSSQEALNTSLKEMVDDLEGNERVEFSSLIITLSYTPGALKRFHGMTASEIMQQARGINTGQPSPSYPQRQSSNGACPTCNTGRYMSTPGTITCPTCKSGDWFGRQNGKCGTCNGSKRIVCPTCGGTGKSR